MENQIDQNVSPTPPVSPVVQTPPLQPPPVSNTEKSKAKFPLAVIIGTILFLLVAGSAAGFYVFKPQIIKLILKPIPTPSVIPRLTKNPSPSPTSNGADSTADWEVYKGKYFDFKYPNNWEVDEKSSTTETVIINTHTPLEYFAVSKSLIMVPYEKQVSLDEYLKVYSYDLNYQKEEKNFGDVHFLYFTSNPNISDKQVRAIVVKDDYKYEVNYIYKNSDHLKVFDQILTAFKFVPPPTPITNSTWQTFPNGQKPSPIKKGSYLFLSAGGNYGIFTPTPLPTSVKWKIYQPIDKSFSVEIPTSWQEIKTAGNSNISIYPPDVNLQMQGPPTGVTFGFGNVYKKPDVNDPTLMQIAPLSLSQISGYTYNTGALVQSRIADFSNNFTVSANISGVMGEDLPDDSLTINVFEHMLSTLAFTK